MSEKRQGSLPLSYEKKEIKEIIIVDDRTFEKCQIKQIQVWSYKKLKHETWLIHLSKHGEKWNIQKVPP